MSIDEPKPKRVCLEPDPEDRDQHLSNTSELQGLLEQRFSRKCLCDLKQADVLEYVNRNLSTISNCDNRIPDAEEQSSILLFLGFVTWIGETYHEQLLSGSICSSIQNHTSNILNRHDDLMQIFCLLKIRNDYLQFSATQTLISLLPLSHCGVDDPLQFSNLFLQRFKEDFFENGSTPTQRSDSLLESICPGETAALDDFFFEEPSSSSRQSKSPPSPANLDQLQYKSLLVSVLAGFVNHAGKTGDHEAGHCPSHCVRAEQEEDSMCQEMQVKCLVIRSMDPVWPQFTSYLSSLLASDNINQSTENLLCDGFRLWQSLISVRANLSFVESRAFSADLATCLPVMSGTLPATVWRHVLDTVSECLCYGTTLGLQSIPPQEPCNVAHTIIRLVRFNKFLSEIPYKHSLGFGGSSSVGDCDSESYDRGLVQKMVLIILKCVALTTREARVDSSSGESDSSSSSRESISSGGSDMIIIERTMSGMYKVLDSWIKEILPVLPDQSLQESLLLILQEQDDVLVEGLLCLLDTHVALYTPGVREPEMALLDTNPSRGFIILVNIVSRDSSVLLDFLVSNETCFLLYFLRFLKFISKNWIEFVETCDAHYDETVGVLLDLKTSISRLLNKSLFPYNIKPVFRLLEKVDSLNRSTKNM